MILSNQYGTPSKKVYDLENIACLVSMGWRKFSFKYKGVDFFYSHNSTQSETAVIFHAAVNPNVKMPVFRGFNWDLRNKNILSISDYVLEKYRVFNSSKITFDATFFLETDSFPVDSIYMEVISFFKKLNSSEIVTFGTSAGGLAALRYASHFKSTALVANAEFYLSRWWNFENTNEVIASQQDSLKNINIEDFLMRNGPPKQLFLSTNVFDEMTYEEHHLPLISFFEKNYPDKVSVIRHCEKHTGKFHTSHFPKNTPHQKLLVSLSTEPRTVCVFTDDISWCKQEFILKKQIVKYFDISKNGGISSNNVGSIVKDSLLIGIFKDKKNAEKIHLNFPIIFDWLLVSKENERLNQPPSKHGVFSVFLPINDELWKSNNFYIFN